MPSLKSIVAGLFLATSTYAASNDSTPPFEITDLQIRKVASANVTIEFTIHDPSKLGKATATCSASWVPKSQGYPQGPYVSKSLHHSYVDLTKHSPETLWQQLIRMAHGELYQR